MVQDRQVPLDVFVGRAAELGQLTEVVSRAQAGQPWLVDIEGDAGVGKTSLIRRGLAAAPELKVLWARADQAEADFEFGLLGQLLRAAGDESRPEFTSDGNGPGAAPQSAFSAGAHLLEVVSELGAAGPLAIVVDDLQWADRTSVQALTFMLRRLSVDPVLAVLIHRGGSDQLSDTAQRLLTSVENRVQMPLTGLGREDVAKLADALTGPVTADTARRLYRATGGHPLYLRTVLSEGSGFDPAAPERLVLPPSLVAAIGRQMRTLPPDTRGILEMLAILNSRLPLAQLGQAAEVESASVAIEPAVTAGLVAWAPEEPSCPVELRHQLIRDAVYAGITPSRRRTLHARAAELVSESASWEHRVAALDRPDDDLAAVLEQAAGRDSVGGQFRLAATHLQWASDISSDRDGRERRLLLATGSLLRAEESRAEVLRPVVEAAQPSVLRDVTLGALALYSGQFAEAARLFTGALAQARDDPGSQLLAAELASWLSGTYLLMGDGKQAVPLERWALGTGLLDGLAVSAARTKIALGTLHTAGPAAALSQLGHLDADPARVGPLDAEGLAYRGMIKLQDGNLPGAVADLSGGLKLVRRGAPLSLGLQPYAFLAVAQYLAGQWDDTLLTGEQAFSAAAVRSRRYELPMLHLAAVCVPAGRGQSDEAEQHARQAEEAATAAGYRPEALFGATARALVSQAAGDYLGMVEAIGPWRDDELSNGRSRAMVMLWRPLLAEGLIGSGRTEQATVVVDQLRDEASPSSYLRPALAWLEGWLAEQQSDIERAEQLYQAGEQLTGTQSPIFTARLLLAHGRLLRRTGKRRPAVERLRRANGIYLGLRAKPFLARTEQELTACHLPANRRPASRAATQQAAALALTNREAEVAHLAGQGLSNPEIASELFISRKAVEYHLSNIYAKCGLDGRAQLRRFVEQWRQPATA